MIREYLKKQAREEFKFDPENGGGRRRRVKKVSRIEMIMAEKNQ